MAGVSGPASSGWPRRTRADSSRRLNVTTTEMTGTNRLAGRRAPHSWRRCWRCPPPRRNGRRDKDVKQLIEQVNHDRDRFEDQLDGKLKRSIIRGPARGSERRALPRRPAGERQQAEGSLQRRQYSAQRGSRRPSLRQGSDIQGLWRRQPSELRRRQRMESSVREPRATWPRPTRQRSRSAPGSRRGA